jgi:hypothetical protein
MVTTTPSASRGQEKIVKFLKSSKGTVTVSGRGEFNVLMCINVIYQYHYPILIFALIISSLVFCAACSDKNARGTGPSAGTETPNGSDGSTGAETPNGSDGSTGTETPNGSDASTGNPGDAPLYEITEEFGGSSRGRLGGLDVMVLTGTYEEIGRAHGVLAGREILDVLDHMMIPFVNDQDPGAWDSILIPQSQHFQLPSPYERELAGILSGIMEKFPRTADRTLTSLNREISVDDLHALNCFIDIYLSFGRCSSFCAWGPFTADGEVVCGRNMDERVVPNYTPVFMVVARKPTELNRMATIDITGPGVIGASTSMNEDGVLLMSHDEQGLEGRASDQWIPRSFVLREAIETIRSADPHRAITERFENKAVTSGNSAHVAKPRGASDWPAIVVEWDANPQNNGATCRLVDHSWIDGALVCANHFVDRRSEPLSSQTNSIQRYGILQNYLSDYHASHKVIGFVDAAEMMHAASVRDINLTYFSVIAFPGKRELHIALSPELGVPATLSQWTIIPWDALFRDQTR